jgi:hypothetical protein
MKKEYTADEKIIISCRSKRNGYVFSGACKRKYYGYSDTYTKIVDTMEEAEFEIIAQNSDGEIAEFNLNQPDMVEELEDLEEELEDDGKLLSMDDFKDKQVRLTWSRA